jgi:hypothetical protein
MRKENMLKEKYWAVRIGDPRRHTPYLQVDEHNKEAPGLYATKESAAKRTGGKPDAKVVHVEVRQIRSPIV